MKLLHHLPLQRQVHVVLLLMLSFVLYFHPFLHFLPFNFCFPLSFLFLLFFGCPVFLNPFFIPIFQNIGPWCQHFSLVISCIVPEFLSLALLSVGRSRFLSFWRIIHYHFVGGKSRATLELENHYLEQQILAQEKFNQVCLLSSIF
jgi:hypothetical protein